MSRADKGVHLSSPPVAAALRVSWVSIAWGAVAGVVSLFLGAEAASLAMMGAGATVLIDLSSSAVLVWRFRHPAGGTRPERYATLVAAALLCVLGVVLTGLGVARLEAGRSAHPGPTSLAVATASLVVLPVIANRKYNVARRVASHALRVDAHITVVGAVTAGVTLTGLALSKAGLTQADPVAGMTVGLTAAAVGVQELRRWIRTGGRD